MKCALKHLLGQFSDMKHKKMYQALRNFHLGSVGKSIKNFLTCRVHASQHTILSEMTLLREGVDL